MSRPERPGMCTSRMMQAGVRWRAAANSEDPSESPTTSYPLREKTSESDSRTPTSSSTMKISSRDFASDIWAPYRRRQTRGNPPCRSQLNVDQLIPEKTTFLSNVDLHEQEP